MPPNNVDLQDSRKGRVDSSPEANNSGKSSPVAPETEEAVKQELKRILDSRYFKTAGRSRQFLQFVVRHRLEGPSDQLKERTIGTEVFQRPIGYATGDDPVVRVQAGEVRRRLEQFYQHEGADSGIKIDLPVGSYRPEFHWKSGAAENLSPLSLPSAGAANAPQIGRRHIQFRILFLIGATGLVLFGIVIAYFTLHGSRQRTTLEEFWAPVLATPQPALICLAKGVTYRPSTEVYDKYRLTHPGKFQTEVEKSSDPLPLDPSEKFQWGQVRLYPDYGVATGDVYSAIRISGVLGQLGKPAQLRIGSDYSFQDLRNSPGIVVGAFNNKWTMRIISNLRFAFFEENGRFIIREQIPNGRTWPLANENEGVWPSPAGSSDQPAQTLDYSIVGRLMDSKTGQFTILAAGLTGAGTEAAGEFISSPELLERAFQNAPQNWKTSNSLFVLKATVTDAVAGPPTVVASYYW